MPSVKIKSHMAYEYLEVFEVIEWRDGCIYKTRPTGQFIHRSHIVDLDSKKYTTTSVSMSMLREDEVKLPLFDLTSVPRH